MTSTTTGFVSVSPCDHCGAYGHHGPASCPRVKAIEYHENGQIKRVEYHDAAPVARQPFDYPWPVPVNPTPWWGTISPDGQRSETHCLDAPVFGPPKSTTVTLN